MMPGKNQQAAWLYKVIASVTGCLALAAGVALAVSLANAQVSLAANANMGGSADSPNVPNLTNTATITNTPTVTRTATPPCGVTYYAASDMPLVIPDSGTVTSTITVLENTYIAYIEVANLYLSHERPEDINVHLYSPWGHRYTLFTDICRRDPWTYANTGLTLVDHSANPIGSACPPYQNSYRSEGSLAARGEYSQGVWTLEVSDDGRNGYSGLLGDWGLRIASMACPSPTSPPSFTATNTPTSTNTPTITSTPIQVVLVGHVNWQGRPAQPNTLQQLPITLTLKAGANEINHSSMATDASGYFTTTANSLTDNLYQWRAKSPKYLANSGTLALSDQHPNVLTESLDVGLMLAGDCNNDNVANILDFNILKLSFGRGIGYPGYDDRADFTGDQMVTIVDFNLLKRNFGTSGAPPISPR